MVASNNPRHRRGFSLRFASPLRFVVGALIVVSLCAGLLILASQIFSGLGVTTRSVYTPEVIVKELRGANELTTAKTNVQQIITAEQSCTIKGTDISLGSKKLLYVAYGEVSAGIDFKELSPENVTVAGDRVTVHLPAPKMLNSHIDVNRSYVYDFQDNHIILATDLACPNLPNQADLQTSAERQALTNIVGAACQNGVLDEANTRAEIAVTKLLQMVKFATVEVKTQTPAPCPTSQPTPQP